MNQSKTPFSGRKIIDLSTVLAGPSVGTFFAELGADVLKVESPDHPDITRSWKLPSEDEHSRVSAYFASANYRKNYLKLDLNADGQRRELLQSVCDADIILMNFKQGDREKLKITDDVLREENPQLIIGEINGFGRDSNRPAYDLILQAETGMMSMNGTPESGPVKMPVALIDVLAAHHLKEGILIELLSKVTHKDYQGGNVSVSLYDAAVSSLVNQASNYLMNEHVPQRIGSLHPNIAPYGELFETADKRTITFAIGSNRHFKKLCGFLKRPDLPKMDEYSSVQARVSNRQKLYDILSSRVNKFNADEILNKMRERLVPCGEVKDLQAVFSTRRARNLVRQEQIEGCPTQRVTSVAFKRYSSTQ